MIAKVTLIDNGYPKGVYEIIPTRTYEEGISTRYLFEFEYNQLNCSKAEKDMQKLGHWIPTPYELDYETDAKCSLCDAWIVDAMSYNYCPNCGAKMIKEVKE